MSREATMLQWRREVRLLRLSLARPAAPNTYGGSASSPLPGLADCPQSFARRERSTRVPETLPCPRLAVQSGQADLGERAGGAVTPALRVAKLGVGSTGGPPSQCLFGRRRRQRAASFNS